MTCSQALETMLEAEPADLSPDGSSMLAVHLRSCAKCARVAATLCADVRALATVMSATPLATPSATKSRWALWPGIALASAAVALSIVTTHEHSVPTAPTLPAGIAPVVVASPAEPATEPAPAPSLRVKTKMYSVAAARYAMPDPVPLDGPAVSHEPASPAPASEQGFDGVSASSNGRVTVLQTSNPKITVIWFN